MKKPAPNLDPLRHAWKNRKPSGQPSPPKKLWSIWIKFTDYSRLKKKVRAVSSQHAVFQLIKAWPDGIRGSGHGEIKYLTVYECDEDDVLKES